MFAISQFTTMPCDAAQDLELYAEAGVERMELCESKFPKGQSERRDLAAGFKDAGIDVASVQTKVHSIFPDRMAPEPKRPEERLAAFKRGIDSWCEILDAPDLPFVLISGVAPKQNLREGWAVATRWIRDAAAYAEGCGARIAFEPLGAPMMHFDTFVYGLDQGVALIDRADSPVIGLVVDAWHVWEEHRLEERLEALAPRVFVVHSCDWPEGGPRGLDDRVLPGDGIIPLQKQIFGPLRAGGFDGPWLIETLSDESLEGSLWKMPPKDLLQAARRASERFD